MKKNKILSMSIIGMMAAVLLTGCLKNEDQELRDQELRLLQQYLSENNITQEPTASGLYYIPITEGTGMSPVLDTWIEIKYVGELLDGTVFTTNVKETAEFHDIESEGFLYGPSRLQVGYLSLAGLNEGIQLMKVGGKAKFILPSGLAMGGYASGPVPAYSSLIYTVELLDAFDDAAQREQEKIWAYLKEGAFENVDSTDSGLYYITTTPGDGELFGDGDDVLVTYTGKFLDGRVFDSNVDKDKFAVSVPATNIIEGWKEGIKLMRNSEKGILIIPYDLGYGELGFVDEFGRTIIPPYMTLVFDMETFHAN